MCQSVDSEKLRMASYPYSYWESPYPGDVYGQFVNNFYGYSRPAPLFEEPHRARITNEDSESCEILTPQSLSGACEEKEEVSILEELIRV